MLASIGTATKGGQLKNLPMAMGNGRCGLAGWLSGVLSWVVAVCVAFGGWGGVWSGGEVWEKVKEVKLGRHDVGRARAGGHATSPSQETE